ncbi:hypothetical protein M8818_000477 [Zalaria obscura]|uniref:Uncharacterized protein n=1 Tax=Zalaria obscura TaxID=2024903 RepID=A0ACC3SNG3_9PEZI
MPKPSIVLVPGAWHVPAHYDRLSSYLAEHGYDVFVVALPSVLPKDGKFPDNLEPEIDAVRSVVTKQLDAGNDVVVVVHSYGALPGTSALKGLDKRTRAAAGHKSSVTAIAYMCSFLLPAGVSLLDGVGGKPHPIHDVRGDMLHVKAPGPAYLFYNDLTREDAVTYTDMLLPQAWSVNQFPCTYAAWKDIPTFYLVCKRDNALLLHEQRGMIDGARVAGANIKAEQCDSGHSPFLSMVELTGDWVRRIAGEEIPSALESY